MASWKACEPLVLKMQDEGDWAGIARLSLVANCDPDVLDAAIECVEGEVGSYYVVEALLNFRCSGGAFFPAEDPAGMWDAAEVATFGLLRAYGRAILCNREDSQRVAIDVLRTGTRVAMEAADLAAEIGDEGVGALFCLCAGLGSIGLDDFRQAVVCFEAADRLSSAPYSRHPAIYGGIKGDSFGNLTWAYHELDLLDKSDEASLRCIEVYQRLWEIAPNEHWRKLALAMRQRMASQMHCCPATEAMTLGDQLMALLNSRPKSDADSRELRGAVQHLRSALLRRAGNAVAAEKAARESLYWYSELERTDSRFAGDVADSNEVLASALLHQGRLEEAAAASSQAVKTHLRLYSQRGPRYARKAIAGYLRGARCCHECGFYEDAWAQFETAKQWAASFAAEDAVRFGLLVVAAAFGSTRSSHQRRSGSGEIDEFDRYELLRGYDEVVGMQRQLQGMGLLVDRSITAHALTAMAEIFVESGDGENAVRSLESAKAWWQSLRDGGEVDYVAGMADCLRVEAALRVLQDVPLAGVDCLAEAVGLFDGFSGVDEMALVAPRIDALFAFADAVIRESESVAPEVLHDAIGHARQARELGERWLASLSDPMLKRRIAAAVNRPSHLLFHYLTTRREGLSEAFSIAESCRSRYLRAMLSDETIEVPASNEELSRRFRAARREMRCATIALAALDRDRHDLESDRASLEERNRLCVERYLAAQQAEHDAIAAIRKIDPAFDPRPSGAQASLDQLRGSLAGHDCVAIQYTISDNCAGALVVSESDCDWVDLPEASAANVERLLSVWSDLIDAPEPRSAEEHSIQKEAIDAFLAEFSQRVLAPIAETLPPGVRSLVVAPHQGLHLLPFAACPLGDGVVAAERWDLRTVPSLSALRPTALSGELTSGKVVIVDASGGGPIWCRSVELAAVSTSLPEASVVVVRASDQLKETLIAECRDATAIHFCCHGNYHPENQLASQLRLGNEHQSARWLRLRDVYQSLKLERSPIVTLSACQTGVLSPDDHDEFVSFPSAFLYAGASAVIATLWNADDLSSCLLMTKFYELLAESRTPSHSLAKAQQWLRGDGVGELASADSLRAYIDSRGLLEAEPDEKVRRRIERLINAACRRADWGPPFASPKYWAVHIVAG
ncbi:CHAT domain-containing protein [Botrimarina mediterranea]|uniref:CHAT domain protein n=1 Tax=Botrimarina mediterranea TaxID=2528022 RepID=A0A518K291_9BACT|nr:CHAT domain-containing protein [Botrimarina mediterranea]QDV71875.1 CHAT domain protein [Botrimarina mediterranea]